MAVTNNNTKIDDSKRQEVLGKSIDSSMYGNTQSDPTVKLAGIRYDFEILVHQTIESYASEIEQKLNKLEAVDSGMAFKGTQLKLALENFINGVKQVSKDYLNGLKEAEKDIITGVRKVYESQDDSIASDLGKDTSKLQY